MDILLNLPNLRTSSWTWLPALFTSLSLLNPSSEVINTSSLTSIDALNATVQGRLSRGTPLAMSCSEDPDSDACRSAQKGYLDAAFRSSIPGAYVNTQWETCQMTEEQCLLDYTNTSDVFPVLPPRGCHLGSIPSYYIDVREVEDVQAAFRFSKDTNMPLVIKNTGHDYKGRSSAPGSLALWTHNLKSISYEPNFRADGCSSQEVHRGVSMGAGVQWQDAYDFAEKHNITVVGGSDRSVGFVGGWLQGGGHGMLSNTMGLGVDRALQFKIVTADGQYLTANACQNQDLFFALRGGGGGTFGVVMESTVLADPQVTLQMAVVSFNSTEERFTKGLWNTMTSNAVQWAKEGWGGIATSQIAIYINPRLDKDEAAKSMTPLMNFGKQVRRDVPGAVATMMEFPSWAKYFQWFANQNVAAAGKSLALGSRLINKESLESEEKQSALVSALLDASKVTPRLIMHSSAPFSHAGDGATSVNEAWRSSVYHITVISTWNWNATTEDKRRAYKAVTRSMDFLRDLTPDAAYLNEADVYEENHEETFWGSNYERLLEIKKK
ncbi:hypothetical protein PQX77_000542 [Marasmius sp. AFHP31]|nr:hypothetical protein PQX77_000542 [Marasmius sp. AFHP31]